MKGGSGDREETMLGIRFFSGGVEEALARSAQGGLVLAPSGPGLATLDTEPAYAEALRRADVNLLDSGLLVMLHNLRHPRRRLTKLSGYLFLDRLLKSGSLAKPGSSFWVMPGEAAARRNVEWLARERGIRLGPEDWAVAPSYPPTGALQDPALVEAIRRRGPRWVILNIGGGVQERLGLHLRDALAPGLRPAIVCTGAAIAFMTGEQASIPSWADRWTLGWLARCLQSPRKFVPRYVRSAKLVWLYLRHGAAPPAAG